ncbi:MAG: hypothetical protein P8179_14165 [Candidatus Thiodiazotropha sp.]|jgi:hypothetical protein
MLDQLKNFILTHWVNPLTLQVFVKNPDAPCYVATLVKELAINSERRASYARRDLLQNHVQLRILG